MRQFVLGVSLVNQVKRDCRIVVSNRSYDRLKMKCEKKKMPGKNTDVRVELKLESLSGLRIM